MQENLKKEKKLSLKISIYSTCFLSLFLLSITIFSYFYFYISEINNFDNNINYLPNFDTSTIYGTTTLKFSTWSVIESDLWKSIAITLSAVDVQTWTSQTINTKILTATPVFKTWNISIAKNQKAFEVARDSLIISQTWSITKNWIFNFENFDTKELLSQKKEIFSYFIAWEYYLFKKVKENWDTIIFAKNISYIKDFILKMVFVSFFSIILFFILVYFLTKYLVKIFLKPIEEHNQKLKEYNHNIAHEIKTPLTILNMNLEMMDGNENLIISSKEEIWKMKNITDSLLFLSENFTLKEIQKFEINKVIKEYIEKENLTKSVEVNYFPENIEINKNKNMFERILKNLIENALKYGCDNKIFIKIEKNNVTFSNKIEKNIEKEKLEKIFETFYQVDEKTNNWYWLGLSLVKRIIEIFKWKINVFQENNAFDVKIEF